MWNSGEMLKACILVILVCSCWLPCCRTQSDYMLSLTVSRNFRSIEPNKLTLNCRFVRESSDIPNALYWLNDTQQELRQLLPEGTYQNDANGFLFTVTRELEGNYFCAPNSSTSPSPETQIIARPLDTEIVQSKQQIALEGSEVVLSPLIPPGALLQQYFIDWMNGTGTETLAFIQGPRSQQPSFMTDERVSVDPDTFELTIKSVRFEDRGPYMGVLGVMDPQGQDFTYSQTMRETVTLNIYVVPSFTTTLPNNRVVSSMTSRTTSFTCTVRGYPRPTIVWYHNTIAVRNSEKYSIQERVISEDPYLVESSLTIMSLSGFDSGSVSCNATVTTPEPREFTASTTALLSVLGVLNRVTPFVTLNREVILRVNLARPVPADIQLLIKYREQGTDRVVETITPNRYSQSDEITYFDERVPYEKFTVDVALTYGNLMGPVSVGMEMFYLSRPTELDPILMNFVLPSAMVVIVILTIGTLVIIGLCIYFCQKPCLQCCFCINPPGSQAAIIGKKINLQKLKIKCQMSPASDRPPHSTGLGGPLYPGSVACEVRAQTDSTRHRKNCLMCLKGLCCETTEEMEAKNTLEEITALLQGANNDTNTSPSGEEEQV